MHAPVTVRHIVHVLKTGEYVVRIEHRILSALLKAFAAHCKYEGVGFEEHQEVAPERAYLANRTLSAPVEAIGAIGVFNDIGLGKEGA